jgi:hypothetical protein
VHMSCQQVSCFADYDVSTHYVGDGAIVAMYCGGVETKLHGPWLLQPDGSSEAGTGRCIQHFGAVG